MCGEVAWKHRYVISAIIGFGLGGTLIAGSHKAENPKAKLLSGVGLLLGEGASIFEHRSALLSPLLFVSGGPRLPFITSWAHGPLIEVRDSN